MAQMGTEPKKYFSDTVRRHNMSAEARSVGLHAELPHGHPMQHGGLLSANPAGGFFKGADGKDAGIGGRMGTKNPATNDQSSAGAHKDFKR